MAEIPKIVLPHGGYKKLIVRERMHAARTAARGDEFDKGLYSKLAEAKTPEELAAKVTELRQKIDRTVWGLRRRKGWS